MNLNLTPLQIVLICSAIVSAIAGASAQLTGIFGAGTAQIIVSVATLINTIMSSVLVPFTGQSAQLKNVLAMPGIEKITVNAQANQTLSAIAVDPTVNKISPTQAAQSDVEKKAAT